MSAPPEKTDAGLRGQDHYRSRLPPWRYGPRQWLLPIVRCETPYVAALQQALRTPTLDAYFAVTANLGTHTFFMIFLPMLFWSGCPTLGRALCQILASGVYLTGFIKDLLCLPRPISPPLHRITMSESAALEYGFPSTHAANALSVTVYALLAVNDPATAINPTLKTAIQIFASIYAASIVLGRLYCGMHGFLDVTTGSIVGALISIVQYNVIDDFDVWFLSSGRMGLVIVLLGVVLLIRLHPEPADDCPCFDDSVAFAGVVFGVELSVWIHAHRIGLDYPWQEDYHFDLAKLGWLTIAIRTVLGIAIVIVWRTIAKKALLRGLPPLFRLINRAGFLLPRRFFKQAPEYDKVPAGIQMDTLIPPISRLPAFVNSIAHPRRNRSVSIGPQSAADAHETISYRQKARRESQSKLGASGVALRGAKSADGAAGMTSYFDEKAVTTASSALLTPEFPLPSADLKAQADSTDPNAVLYTPSGAEARHTATPLLRTPSSDRREKEEEQAVFASLPKPRTRFDIEIVTKLVVYTGIALLGAGLNVIIFEYLGLG